MIKEIVLLNILNKDKLYNKYLYKNGNVLYAIVYDEITNTILCIDIDGYDMLRVFVEYKPTYNWGAWLYDISYL